eukprot:gene10569-12225_t
MGVGPGAPAATFQSSAPLGTPSPLFIPMQPGMSNQHMMQMQTGLRSQPVCHDGADAAGKSFNAPPLAFSLLLPPAPADAAWQFSLSEFRYCWLLLAFPAAGLVGLLCSYPLVHEPGIANSAHAHQQAQYMQQQGMLGGGGMYGSAQQQLTPPHPTSTPPPAPATSSSSKRFTSPMIGRAQSQGRSQPSEPTRGNARFVSPARDPSEGQPGHATSGGLCKPYRRGPWGRALLAQQQQQMLAQQYSELQQQEEEAEKERGGIAYSRKPRPMEDFTPYDQKFLVLMFMATNQDYEDKEYNVKQKGKNYWELGKLGPDLETEELQAKREKQERIKRLAAEVRESNLRKALSAQASEAAVARKEKEKEPTKRERALAFAKSVPKPEPAKLKPMSAGPASPLTTAPKPSELDLLEAQHRADRERVEAIRSELARLL